MLSITQVLLCAAVLYVASAQTLSLDLDVGAVCNSPGSRTSTCKYIQDCPKAVEDFRTLGKKLIVCNFREDQPVICCEQAGNLPPPGQKSEDSNSAVQLAEINAPCQQKETSYTIFTDPKKNWYEAFAACREIGLDLATIETEEEYQIVYAQIKGMNQSFWLSATDLAQNGSFVWMSTGHKVTYHKWHRNSDLYQPDNALYQGEVEHCMSLHHFYGHEMNDNICSITLSYICDDRNKINPENLERKKKEFTVFTGNKVNWFEAIADCKTHGLRLATVESEEEHQDVVNTIKSQVPATGRLTDFWLSGSNLGRKGTYKWMSTGRRVNYTAWHSGPQDEQPDYQVFNGETEHCIAMRNKFEYKWNDRVCSSRNYYICDNQYDTDPEVSKEEPHLDFKIGI